MDSWKRLLTIQQASEALGVPRPTLRFWEKEFAGILNPARSDGGQRRYTERDIQIIARIKRLKDEGRTLSEIGDLLSRQAFEGVEKRDLDGLDLLARRIAEAVTAEVCRFLEARDSK